MRKFLAFLGSIAAFLPIAVTQAAEAPSRFQHDGKTYVYTTKQVGRVQVIEGHQYPSGSAFRFQVAGNNVNGVIGGQTVSFRASDARGAARLGTGVQTVAR